MLSRNAEGLYWMGRYLERAEHVCRLLRLQVEALVDRPVREIHVGWSRIYGNLNRQPPVGNLDFHGDDEYTLADSFTLADNLTFDRMNPDAVLSCFTMGRENARQMRHCVSREMWTSLNLSYLRIRDLAIQDIWKASPESFYAETARDVDTFMGVAETTMYRDEGWHFMQLGRTIERAQLLSALLLAQLAAASDDSLDSDWTDLLRAYQAFDAYSSRYGVDIRPHRILDLLITDRLLPGSLCRSLDTAAETLDAMAPDPVPRTGDAARRLAGRLRALVRFEWPDRNDREKLLPQFLEHCRTLHDLVTAAYFDYAAEDAPRL